MKFEDAVHAFLEELDHFDYDLSCIDLVWDLIFPDSKGKWYHVHVTKNRHTFYISHIDDNSCALEAVPKKSVQVMGPLCAVNSRMAVKRVCRETLFFTSV